MRNKLVTLEKIKLQQKLFASFSCSYSDDQRLSLIAEHGVYIFELSRDSENRMSAFCFTKFFFPLSQYRASDGIKPFAISDNVGIDINNFIDSLDQYDVYEAIMDVHLSQNLNSATPAGVAVIGTQWSPKGLDKGQFCLLGVLSNTGVLEIVARRLHVGDITEYYSACNISEYCVHAFTTDFRDFSKQSPNEQLAELKRRIAKVRITAFTWGHVFKTNDSNCTYLFCGHKDGGVSVWNICSVSHCDLVTVHNSYFRSSLEHITAMTWINGGSSGLLVIGDLHGQINAVIVKSAAGCLQFDETVVYPTIDDIKIECIKHFMHNQHMYIVVGKGTFVIVTVFNSDCELLTQKIFRCGNLAITGLEHYENDTILVLTCTGVLKELQLIYESNKLSIEEKDLETEIKWQKYRAHGLFVSRNRVFVGLLIHPCRLKSFAKTNYFMKAVLLKDQSKKPVKILLNNKTGSLDDYWDCFETLRSYGLRQKKYPCEKYPFISTMNYDTLCFLEIKTLLHLSKITKVIYAKKVLDVNRNIESSTVFNLLVQIELAIKRMKDLVRLHSEKKELTLLQMNSLELANSYLSEIILGNTLRKLGLTKYTAQKIYDLMAYVHNLEFPPMPKCFWCSNTITGLVCMPSHADTRCAVSFVQITEPVSYKCQFCKCAVHKSVVEEEKQMKCPFCDAPLHQTVFKDKLQDRLANRENESRDLCAEDCLTEGLDINDVEEEAGVVLDNYGYVPRGGPDWDGISVSGASTADNSDVDYIFEKELARADGNEGEEMNVD